MKFQKTLDNAESLIIIGGVLLAGYFVYRGYVASKVVANKLGGAAGAVADAAQKSVAVLQGPFGKDADMKANVAALKGDVLGASIYMPAMDFLRYMTDGSYSYAKTANDYWAKNPNGNFYDN